MDSYAKSLLTFLEGNTGMMNITLFFLKEISTISSALEELQEHSESGISAGQEQPEEKSLKQGGLWMGTWFVRTISEIFREI